MPEIKQYNRTIQRPKQSCDLECLRSGFARYYAENGRLPTSQEITDCEYLPSARQITRRYGSLSHVRSQLGYRDTDLRHTISRPVSALRTTMRGYSTERQIESELVSKFGEVFVHIEKPYGDTRKRVDFFVYSPDGNFGVDVFYTNSDETYRVNVNTKLKKYIDFPPEHDLYFLCLNPEISQVFMSHLMLISTHFSNYSNLKLVTYKTFNEIIKDKRSYPNPENYIASPYPDASAGSPPSSDSKLPL